MNKSLIIKLSTTLALLFLGANLFAQKGLPTMRDYKEFGLKSKKVEKVFFSVENAEGKPVEMVEIFFDNKGYRTKEVIYNTKENKRYTTTWEYNNKEKKVSCYRLTNLDKTEWRRVFLYDPKAKKVSMNHYADWYDIKSDSIIADSHFYTKTWQVKEDRIQRREATLNIREGRVASLTEEYSPVITKFNTLLQDVNYITSAGSYNWLYSYINNYLKANTIKKEQNDNRTIFYVNKKGLPFEKKSISFQNEVVGHTTYIMEYDSKKNWTKLTQLENGFPTYVVKREITYR